MTVELSGRELSEAVCRKLGYEVPHPAWTWAKSPNGRRIEIDFAESLDRCFAPEGIAEWLEAHGYALVITTHQPTAWRVDILKRSGGRDWHAAILAAEAIDTIAASALCRAFLQVSDQ